MDEVIELPLTNDKETEEPKTRQMAKKTRHVVPNTSESDDDGSLAKKSSSSDSDDSTEGPLLLTPAKCCALLWQETSLHN